MDLNKIIAQLREIYGDEPFIGMGSAEKKPTDIKGPGFTTVRAVKLLAIEEYVRTNFVKTRSYFSEDLMYDYAVYSHKPKAEQVACARFKAMRNQRTLYHGCTFTTLLSVIDDGCRLRHTKQESCLLGIDGVYVGTYEKAQTYGRSFGDMRPGHGTHRAFGFSGSPAIRQLNSLLHGVTLKVRVDLGSVLSVGNKTHKRYEDVKDKYDTLAGYKGATAGGKVWGGQLRNSEWVITSDQAVIEEVHVRGHAGTLHTIRSERAQASGRKYVQPNKRFVKNA